MGIYCIATSDDSFILHNDSFFLAIDSEFLACGACGSQVPKVDYPLNSAFSSHLAVEKKLCK